MKFIGIFQIHEAKHHKLELSKQAVESELRFNDQTCRSGCQVSVELWVSEEQLSQVESYFLEHHTKILKGHNVDSRLMSQVFDSEAKEVVCQACGYKFDPKLSECPDCGLFYG